MTNTKGIQRTFIVSFDHTQGDKAVLLVGEESQKPKVDEFGRKIPGVIDVIAAYSENEAIDIYNKIVGGEKK